MDDLREQIARALRESVYPDRKSRAPESEWLRRADAVIAVLPDLAEVELERDEIRAQHAEAWTSIGNLRAALDAAEARLAEVERERKEAVTVLEAAQIGRALVEARLDEALDVLRDLSPWLAHLEREAEDWAPHAEAALLRDLARARALLGYDRS